MYIAYYKIPGKTDQDVECRPLLRLLECVMVVDSKPNVRVLEG